jgi:hypothetical protein
MSHSARSLLTLLAADAVVLWALSELMGSSGLIAMGGVLGTTLFLWRQGHGTRALRRETAMTARALADHRDPGPQDRAAVDARAQQLLAAPRSDEWLPAVLLLALAAACVVVAVVRGDVTVALPAVLLLPAAVTAWVVVHRRLLAAASWSEDPPYEQERA